MEVHWRYLLHVCILIHLTAWVTGAKGRCSLFGRQHIHTFDGVLYDFPGDCSYLLAGDCTQRSFTLLGDFVNGKRVGITLFLGEAFELHMSVDGILSQGEKILSVPYASHSLFVGTELGFYKLWSEEFGFSVTIDNAANVAVTLSEQHVNRTCGLCGNYNAITADEYTAQEGFVTEDSYDFANSWAAKGVGQTCQRVTPPTQTCNSTQRTTEILSGCSVLGQSSVFLHCAHVVPPEGFVALCQQEACHCEGAPEDCSCPVLLEYARTCHAHGVVLTGWTAQSQCEICMKGAICNFFGVGSVTCLSPWRQAGDATRLTCRADLWRDNPAYMPKCPIGMQYSECTKSCSTTCHSLNIQEVCTEECSDGCTCPVGKVLDGKRCVEVSLCSCVHMGRHFPPGSTISQDCNTCVCRHGSWECTNEGCPGECLVLGQSHFKTFDDKFFTFTGQCHFLLAKDCAENEFSVIIENVQCADDQDAVCTRSVTLSLPSLENMTIKLKHGGLVSVNSMDIQTPMHHGHLHIQRLVQSAVHVRFREDFQMEWDGRGRLRLKLGPRWQGHTCGLCGNYNGNQGDDFLSGSGLVEGGAQAFGQSWRINGDCEAIHRQEGDPCSSNPKRVRFAEEACSVIMSEVFSPCHFLVNPAPFQRFCRYDVCACTDGEECFCSALAAYASTCSARGVLLNWRSPSLCAMQCSGGQLYEACGRTCERTCRSLSGGEYGCGAESVCEEGCFCPPGKYLTESGQCVTSDLCPCLHDGQLYQPQDVYADHHVICHCENGAMHCSSTEEGAMLSDMFFDDDLAPSRERRSAQCAPPLVRADCGASGGTGLECARTCQNMNLPCVSTACIPGCLCPLGTVRHRRDCIAPEECPCYHNNRPYASGQTITMECNTCVCQKAKWQCTDKVCDGVCHTVGEGHYITFDGLKYSFPGFCQYVLVQDMCGGEEGSFRVLVENEACGIVGHRCAKAITIYFQGGVIVMQNGEVKMKKPVLLDSQVQVVRSGHSYTVLLGKHIFLSWDRGTHLRVHVSAVYRGKVCGLCGNYDGYVNNDLMSSNKQLEVDAPHFGNSWKVVPSCADVTQLPVPCNDNMVKLVTVEQSCRVLTGPIFKECNSQIDAEPYVDMCIEAACSCPSVGDCACFCDVVAAYALACSEQGLSVSWRSNQLCPLSCEDLNPKSADTGEELCQWRYNACGPACPISCQHPEPLHCSLTCVEGCHVHCPPGQLLDEVLLRCVEPSQCQVCVHDGQTISHGTKILLNQEDPDKCKICDCESNTLHCEDCASSVSLTTPAPTHPWVTQSTLLYSTLMPEGNCDRAMDLAFLLDGSEALSEEEFQVTKDFILGVVERFRMGSAHTRATVLLYHSGVKTYDLQVQKWLFKKTVRELHYTGGDAAFLDEAIKYLAINIYDKNKREHAGRVAIILTASENPRSMRAILKLLRRKSITTLTVALGPGVDMAQINEITKVSPDNRAYILSSTGELNDRLLEVTDYLCTLGLEPEVDKPKTTLTTTSTTTTTTSATTTTTATPNLPKSSTKPAAFSPTTSPLSPLPPTKDLTFIVEGSDAVGEANFNKSLTFLEEVITQLTQEKEEVIRITVIQYSVTVTIEISHWEIRWHKQRLVERLREIRWRGGNKTNTGAAVTTVLQQMATAPPTGPTSPPQLVFLVTENPPTDIIPRPTHNTQTHFYPIGVGPKVKEMDLFPLSSPQRPLMVEHYFNLTNIVHHVINITKTTILPRSPTLPPLVLPTLPPSVPCDKPMDILFLLKAGEQLTDAKTFVKTFIMNAKIGPKDTQIGVIQYGEKNTAEITWKQEQSREELLSLVDRVPSRTPAPPQLGAALRFAIQTSLSPASGGRAGAAKIVVMVILDKSTDDVKEAANEALAAGVSMFPIGVGPGYDRAELSMLGHHGTQDNSLHLSSMDQLLLLLTLDHGYTERMCRAGPPGMCVDDNGTERKPGELWLLEDGCHSLLCHPSGAVTVQSHKVSCDSMEPPACTNNMPAVRVQETCNCHWECPCMCMGSSTNHVVRFDGLALRLDSEGLCSYTLLTVKKSLGDSSEVKLHNGPCSHPSEYNQVCMKAIEVIHELHTIILKDDMTALMGREELALPWRHAGLELVRYGGIMLQLKSDHGYTLTFTPHSNEFTITMLSSSAAGPTNGLCGACGEEQANHLHLRNGSLTSDHSAFMWDWSSSGGVEGDEGVCVPRKRLLCGLGVSMGCQALRSEVFAPCHSVVPVQLFLSRCEEQVCEQSDVCEVLTAYAQMCRQNGACVHWRGPHLCPFQCPSPMEYHACRSGCVEDCRSIQTLAEERNSTSCVDTPTEGCYCAEGMVLHQGVCVSPDSCTQCVDQQGHTHAYMQSWVPEENPCLICLCLDQQRINCTARPCNDIKAPVCGPCEILREKRESKCCPEYECVCDLTNCSAPEVPQCEDGQILVLKNPGECQPVHECVCKKEQCDLQPPPTCPPYRQLSVKKTTCCDAFECKCKCQNSTRSCPTGFITSTSTNDCGCTVTTCEPDKVCVVGAQTHPVGSEWEDGCTKCVCTQQQDAHSSLYVPHCSPRTCDTSCPLGSTYAPSDSECCGKCVTSSCVVSHGEMRGDTLIGAQIRYVGEVWPSPLDQCVLQECVKVHEQVFVTEKNVSCSAMDTPFCPLGSELHCAKEGCCPFCHCVPVEACLFNNTLIGPGEHLMVDPCTHCECQVETEAVRKFKLSCKRTSCPECPMGYSLQKEEGACCGHCVATTCFIQKTDGTLSSLPVNSTREEGCNLYSCSLSPQGDLVAQVKVTTCPAFDSQACHDHGGTVSPLGDSCCETCVEPECQKTKGTLNYIRVDDCQSEQQVELHYCEGKCRSRSLYSLERGAVEKECVCCSALDTQALSVPVVCDNGTRSLQTVLSVTKCDCVSRHCD